MPSGIRMRSSLESKLEIKKKRTQHGVQDSEYACDWSDPQ